MSEKPASTLDNQSTASHAVEGRGRAPIEVLADEFVQRVRQGDDPRIHDYVAAHPDLAEEIKELFPTLAMLERMAPNQALSASDTVSEADIPVPTKLGEYRILGEIGRGGMGVVYEAEHDTMGRRVALKVLPATLASRKTNLERFLREARAAGRLHHSNIVPVFEVGVHGERHYYAMQFIQGQNLDVVIEELKRLRAVEKGQSTAADCDQRPATALSETVAQGLHRGGYQVGPLHESGEMYLRPGDQLGEPSRSASSTVLEAPSTASTEVNESTRYVAEGSDSSSVSTGELSAVGQQREDYYHRVARIGVQVAEALDYAHGQGVLHRDIKPSNLILDTAGVVWITDFGLAKNTGDDFTHTGDVVGTLRYMAPERFKGEADERCDVYSLGLTLYELCTLRYAFQADDRMELVHQLTHSQPLPPRKLDHQIPRDLETVILKATAREPSARYPHARALAEDLWLFLTDCPIRSRRTSTAERLFRWCRRNPTLSALSFAVFVLLIALMAGSLFYAWKTQTHATRLHHETVRALAAEQVAEQARYEATARLYDSHADRARSGRWSGRPGQHYASLDALTEAARILPTLELSDNERQIQRRVLRNEAIAAMPLVDVRVAQEWNDNQALGVNFSPDFSQYACSDPQGNIELRRVNDNVPLRSFDGPGQRAWVIRFSPDGRWFGAKHHRGGARPTPPVVQVWNAATGELLFRCDKKLQDAPMAFRRDSGAVAIGFADGMVRQFELPSGRQLGSFQLGSSVMELAYSTDGRQLMAAYRNHRRVVLIDTTASEQREITLPADVTSVAWRTRHQEFAVGCRDGAIHLLSLEPAHRERRRLIGHTRQVVKLQFICRGRILASKAWDGTTRLWNVEAGQESLRIDGDAMIDTGLDMNDRLGFNRGGSEFGIWEVAGGEPLVFLQHLDTTDRRWSVRFHPQYPRLVLSGTSRGLELWDTRCQQLVEVVGTREVRGIAFIRDGQTLLTTGTEGLQARSITIDQPNSAEPLQVHVSPPQSLYQGVLGDLDLDLRGRLAVAKQLRDSAIIVDLAQPEESARVLSGHLNLDRLAVSPRGDLVVTTTWKGAGIQLWDVSQQRPILDLLPQSGSATARFSSDGQYLAVTTGQRLYVWQHDSWLTPLVLRREQPDGWPATVAFSPDGQLLAAPYSRFLVQLVRPSDGTQVALFTSPATGKTLEDYAFCADGHFFAAADPERIHVWDLRDLRARLRTMNLDWRESSELRNPSRLP